MIIWIFTSERMMKCVCPVSHPNCIDAFEKLWIVKEDSFKVLSFICSKFITYTYLYVLSTMLCFHFLSVYNFLSVLWDTSIKNILKSIKEKLIYFGWHKDHYF